MMNCNETEDHLIDYLDGDVRDTKKKEIENHLTTCVSCQQELKSLQLLLRNLKAESASIQVPLGFMGNVRDKLSKTKEKKRKPARHRAILGLTASLFFMLFVGTAVATNGFTNMIDWWKSLSDLQNEQVEHSIKHGVGEYLNLVTESNGVKVKITSVVADDIQTLIYYEIEDTLKENKYMINYAEGLEVANLQDWTREDSLIDSPVTSHLSLYSESDYIFKGRLGVMPMSGDEGNIQVKLHKLEKAIDQEGSANIPAGNDDFIEGDWAVDIPIKKYPSIVHDIQVETEIDGNPVIFDQIKLAPTMTILSYRYRNENQDKNMEMLEIASLESKGKHVYDQHGLGGSVSGGSADGWNSAEATFESLYFEKPADIRIHLKSATFSVKEPAQFTIDTSKKLPQTFDYLGNKISIEKIAIGNPTKIMMTESLGPERTYERLDYHIYNKDGEGSLSVNVDGYFIDKEGKQYKAIDNFYRLAELENPIFFSTEHQIELSRNGDENAFVPVELKIEGYTITSFYDNVIDISFE